jgi:hypothetical protein
VLVLENKICSNFQSKQTLNIQSEIFILFIKVLHIFKPIKMTTSQITNEEYFERVAEGNLGKVKEFLSTGGNIYAVDEMLMTGLQISCFYGHKEIVNYLLFEKNFFKDTKETFQKNCGGESLNMACSGGHLDIVQILIEEIGVDVNNSGFLLPTDPPIVHARFSIIF